MDIKEISDLLDEKLKPIISRLERVEEKIDNVLAFVSTGNEDISKELKKLKKVH